LSETLSSLSTLEERVLNSLDLHHCVEAMRYACGP